LGGLSFLETGLLLRNNLIRVASNAEVAATGRLATAVVVTKGGSGKGGEFIVSVKID
jgi:hypothetical protein